MPATLQSEIARYAGKGYRVISQTPDSAQLVKPKKFSIVAFVLLLLLGIFPGVLYFAWYMAKKDETIYLYVESDGRVQRKGGKWTLGGAIAERVRAS